MPQPHPARASARRAVREDTRPALSRRDADGARRKTQARLEIELQVPARASMHPLACGKGCAMCCHLRVAAMPVEVIGVVQYLRGQLPAQALSACVDRIRNAASRVAALPRERLLSVNIPCPMLEEDGACGIYPARPLNCRAYHSLDVEACRDAFEHPADLSATHPQSEWIAAINGGAQEGLREGLRAIGIDTTQYEFVTALAEAFEDADCARRHDAGEPVFGSAVRL